VYHCLIKRILLCFNLLFHAEFGCSVFYRAGVAYVGALRILGCCGSTPLRYGSWVAVETRPSLGWGRGWLIETRPSGPTPACVAVPKVAPGQTVTKFTMRMRNTTWPIGGCYKLTTNFFFFFFFFFSRRFPCRYRLGLPITRSFPLLHDIQCLKWSKKEAGSLPQSEVDFPSADFFCLKIVSFGASWVVFYVI